MSGEHGSAPSPLLRADIIEALRTGTVPRRGLEHYAVGLERFEAVLGEELERVATGRGKFKAVRGEYGNGKTFFARWLEHQARSREFATALVQVSETETPLYKLETVYRRAVENLQTSEWPSGAFRSLIDDWFFGLEDEALRKLGPTQEDPQVVTQAVGKLLEERLSEVSATQPLFAAALRRVHRARVEGDEAVAEGLISWLMGQPNVAASIKREAGLKGDLDNDVAAGFFRGLLEVLRQTRRRGLLLVLDEVETIQRVRADSREKSLNALRQLIDDLNADRYPRMYVLITGTPQFFDGTQGVKRLPPLHERLKQEFRSDHRFDSARATQIRLPPFDLDKLCQVGLRVRDLYPSAHPERLSKTVHDEVVRGVATSIAGQLGGKTGIAPRLFLRTLVQLLDIVEEHPDFDPLRDGNLQLDADVLTETERQAAGIAPRLDDIDLSAVGPVDSDL